MCCVVRIRWGWGLQKTGGRDGTFQPWRRLPLGRVSPIPSGTRGRYIQNVYVCVVALQSDTVLLFRMARKRGRVSVWGSTVRACRPQSFTERAVTEGCPVHLQWLLVCCCAPIGVFFSRFLFASIPRPLYTYLRMYIQANTHTERHTVLTHIFPHISATSLPVSLSMT
jgi:hypothetical protein